MIDPAESRPGYRTQSPDTSIEAELVLFDGYRRMTPGERVRRACDLAEAGRRIALVHLRRRFPEASARDLQLRLASWNIPLADLKAAYGWTPAERGEDATGPDSGP